MACRDRISSMWIIKTDRRIFGESGEHNISEVASISKTNEGKIDEKSEKLSAYVLYLAKLLRFFNHKKLESLHIWGVATESCFVYTLEALKHVRVLNLQDIKIKDWSSLVCLRELKVLQLASCDVNDLELGNILKVNYLEEFTVYK